MEILYLGHSAFAVRLDSGRRVAIDPFLTGNPRAAARPDDLLDCDLVLVTHDHEDHLGDAFPLCKRSGATLVGIFELAMAAQAEGITVEPMSIGGAIDLDGLVVHMVNAQHGAGQGHAAGFVLESGAHNLYFAGDTALFGDMRLYGDLWDLDVAALPVGDRFTMGPDHASRAVEMLRPRHVIPCHYGTFPILLPDASRFEQLAGDLAEIHSLEPGEKLEL
jgi:L-ascorbate metabolism protein UlaG (beta-lactamase superfamily)